jgi:hypothetical protein
MSRNKEKPNLRRDPWEEERQAHVEDEQRAIRHEHEEFDIEDLPPMSGRQKFVLFLVIVLVVAGLFYLLSFWLGLL